MGGGGGLQGSFSISEQARPVLQAEDIRSVGHGQQLLKIAGIPHVVLAERTPWYEYPELSRRLNDPREITNGVADHWRPHRLKRQLFLPAPLPEEEPDSEEEVDFNAKLLAMQMEDNEALRQRIAELESQQALSATKDDHA